MTLRCEACGEAEATIHLTRIVSAPPPDLPTSTTHDYCRACAEARGVPLDLGVPLDASPLDEHAVWDDLARTLAGFELALQESPDQRDTVGDAVRRVQRLAEQVETDLPPEIASALARLLALTAR